MDNVSISTIGICGAGTMGSGIAQVAAAAGFTVLLYDVNEAMLQSARSNITKGLQKLVTKQKLTAEAKENALQRLTFITDVQACKANLIIEAIVEKLEAKVALFNQLATINSAQTILASNTSSLSITATAGHLNNPARVAGLHFFNPAPVMPLVEIVKGEQTAHHTVQQLVQLIQQMNKTPVVCKDAPGFIVNRVARPFYIEALRLLEEGVATIETIDSLMEDKGFKMGPFKLMDLIGNDINYAVSCSVYEQLKQPQRLQPSYIQKEKVATNELGKKTGKGYYKYQ